MIRTAQGEDSLAGTMLDVFRGEKRRLDSSLAEAVRKPQSPTSNKEHGDRKIGDNDYLQNRM